MNTAGHNPIRSHRPRRGSVLIVAMWITVALTGMVLVFCQEMRVEESAAANSAASLQADAIARGAIAYSISRLQARPGELPEPADMPCEAVPVGGGYFWILRHEMADDRNYYFGLTDECSKLSLNSATRDMLAALPNMTPDLAQAIVDWRSSSADLQSGGAQSAYYMTLNPPYMAKSDRFETVDELGLVRDVTPEVLIGEDANRNGLLDPNEDDGDLSDPPDNRNGRLERGLLDYVTVWSRDTGKSLGGQTRIDVNTNEGSRLRRLLEQNLSSDRMSSVWTLTRTQRPFVNVLDYYFRVKLTPEEFRTIADRLTAGRPKTDGLVNVATAPLEVLQCLPGMDPATAQSLINRRSSEADVTNLAWVVQALPADKARQIGSYITTHTFRVSADIIAVDGHGRAFKRYWAVIDNRTDTPQVIYFKDLTGLGWPLDPQILRDLKAGRPIAATTSQGLFSGGVR